MDERTTLSCACCSYQGTLEVRQAVGRTTANSARLPDDPTFADKFDLILCLFAQREEPPDHIPSDGVGKRILVRVGQPRGGIWGVVGGLSPRAMRPSRLNCTTR